MFPLTTYRCQLLKSSSVLKIIMFVSECVYVWAFPDGTSGKEPTCQCRRHKRCRFIPWVRKIPRGVHENPLQYSFLENPMGRGAWKATVHGVTKNRTRWSDFHFHFTSELFSCDMGGMGSSSPTRGRTQVPCIGSTEF